MTPDEVRMLDNRYALLFIRGERPVMDLKYDLLKHPNVSETADGGMEPYIHGEAKAAVATILAESFYAGKETLQPEELSEGEYVLLSESDIQELYEMEEDV